MIDKVIALAVAIMMINTGMDMKSHESDDNELSQAASRSVGNLPHANGMKFDALDQYLEHLRKKGAMDIPYYELQSDGRYRLITGRGGNRVPPVYFTRDELKKKFGFSQ